MRILLTVSLMLTALMASPSFASEHFHLAAIQDVTLEKHDENGWRYRVTYVRHCNDVLMGAFLTHVPMRVVTEHIRSVVGVLVKDTGVHCEAADAIEQTPVVIRSRDVADSGAPATIQPE